ncbi:hypothetical protein [Haloarchaeobius sp. TZWWS8]|uniref:hypothetical protein n=1 Tax=Haloarchaeobius sp. TZWWS8 TaxID=3446121 RepID=UPI003EBC8212
MTGAALPDGWQREYEGRHGAEYFYEPRNLTVSILPRYESARARASTMEPTSYLVRVHRLFSSDFAVPLTIGTARTFERATDLAMRYMEQFSTKFVRHGVDGFEPALEVLSAVADYSDDLLVSLVRSRTRWGLRAIAHCSPEDITVVHQRDGTSLSEREATELYEAVRDAAAAVAGDRRPTASLTVTEQDAVAWVMPRGDPGAGTLFVFDPDVAMETPTLFEELTELLRRRSES